MTHIQTNINKFYSKLQEFWNLDKYTDVTIECGDRSFKCHRLALATTCEYFDAMFGGFFKERTTEIITLKDIAAETFEQVLKFIYTGDLVVNSNNVAGLLKAREFFNLPGIEDLCIQFLEKNSFTSQNIFDVFVFACLAKKNTIIDMCARYFQRWFEILSIDERFLEIPFDDLKIIINEFLKLTKPNENSLLNGIIQWIQRDRFSRVQYSSELFGVINFKNISSSKIRIMCERLVLHDNINLLTQSIEPLNRNTALTCDTSSECPKLGLHLFVNDHEKKMKSILSMNGTRLCLSTSEILVNESTWTRCVAVDDSYLYDFSFYEVGPSKFDTGWEQKFCVYSSVDMCSEIQLNPPPIQLYGKCTGAGAIQNHIYLYHPYPLYFQIKGKEYLRKTSSSSSFSVEEICRGIYSYNCETDEWFSMPEMRKKLHQSCMSICHNTLYIIGGHAYSEEFNVAGYAQAYDPREGIWRELPRSSRIYSSAASCAIDDKIYVCGGNKHSGVELERYDAIAGKWEELAPMSTPLYYHRAVAYMNQLWALDFKDIQEKLFENSVIIEVYNPTTNVWRNFEATAEENVQCGCIMDAVVFKFP